MSRTVKLNKRDVAVATIQVNGIDHSDYPDYANAYVDSAQYTDGTDLSFEELDQLQEQYPDVVYDIIVESAVDQADFAKDLMFDR